MARPIQFYTPIGKVTVYNWEVVPLLIHMEWYGQRVAHNIHLRISHPESADHHAELFTSEFHKVLWDDISEFSRRGRLRLEGLHEGKRLFALLDFDMSREGLDSSIMFSPVPFGCDGHPIPPKDLPLEIAAGALSIHPQSNWSFQELVAHTNALLKCEVDPSDVSTGVIYLLILQAVQRFGSKYRTVMSCGQFERLFGVRLPVRNK